MYILKQKITESIYNKIPLASSIYYKLNNKLITLEVNKMFLAEDEKYEYERDDQPMVKARITVTFDIYVEIPDFDPELVDPDPMLEQAVKEYEYKAEDISNWEFDEYV